MEGSRNVGFQNDEELETKDVHFDRDKNNVTLKSIRITSEEEVKSQEKLTPAVMVRKAYKSYGKHTQVLKNYNMTVMEGTIYSLLGSSGCGKTTILSAIVGLKSLDSGQLRVYGEIPGTTASGIPGNCVGHMPQDHALHVPLSIQESFNYYGLIYNMSSTQVKERSKFLLNFLSLPKPDQIIATLSGGQKRRVSLAIAMIHEPKLLILDEPTVGVDHLLRESIWNLLRNLVANGNTTVIITTHYIEEARGSSTIGLMRNGRLLTEKNPTDLLAEYNVTLLEDIVLILSRKDIEMDDGEDRKQNNSPNLVFNEEPYLNEAHIFESKKNHSKREEVKGIFSENRNSLSRIRGLVQKNLIILFRNYIFLLCHIFLPAFQILVVCLAIGNEPKNLKFGVVNHENPSCIQSVRTLDPNGTDCGSNNLGCMFVGILPDDDVLNLVTFSSEEDALLAVEKGYTWGYLSIPANFSSDLRERMISGVFVTNESYEGSAITFQLDMSSQTIGITLQRIFFTTFQTFSAEMLRECDFDPRASELPLKFKNPVYGSANTTFREYLAPSSLLGLLFFFPLVHSGVTYITDRKAGTLDRSLVAGVTTFEVMVASLIIQILELIVETGLAFFTLTEVFMIEVQGSVVTAVCLTILVGIAGMSMGFGIATFCEEEVHAVLLGMGFFFPNFLLAGMVWPVEAMPLFLQYISYLLPCTLACEAMRSIVTRGWNILHPRVFSGFLSTLAWIIIYWALCILVHKHSNKRR